MDAFERKTLKTSRGYTYTYYVSPGDKALPTLLFQHGWPDHAAMWKNVAGPLRSTNHPIIIPDMLGYAGTDKPTDISAYKWDAVTKDLIEILDAENAQKCISIGHDWGSGCASRVYSHYPSRVVGLVNLNVAYLHPGREPFDLDTNNAMTKQIFGYALFEYWNLFAADDGPAVLKGDLDRLYNTMHGEGETMKKFFCAPGAMRDYLTHKIDADVPLRPYARDETFKKEFIDRMSRDGFEGSQCWYKAMVRNYQHESDKFLPEDRDTVHVPALYIGCKDDAVCRPEGMYESIQKGLLPHLEQAEMIDAAHWVMYEKPQEVVTRLEDWLTRHYK
jgi:soluble epoxide hydrolase/lipid-phosphate phosphatase